MCYVIMFCFVGEDFVVVEVFFENVSMFDG